MQLRTYLSGLAVLAFAFAATAGPGEAAFQPRLPDIPGKVHQAQAGHEARPPLILAQASDPRLVSLEEEIRRLNGRLEELNFQILQMQDDMRRMQEDNEFRFEELEGRRSDAAGGEPVQRAERPATPPASADPAAPAAPPAATAEAPGGSTDPQLGQPPRVLGTITFDERGNVVTSGAEEPIDLLQGNQAPAGDAATVAALPPSSNPDEIYRNAYEFILSGDYGTAESGFRQYLERFPGGEHAADASFWLGEALLAQARHREAAEVFLQANRDFPDARKAPEMLLKLGISLAALDQRDVACATYTEIGQRYPGASDALKQRVGQEQAAAGC